MKAIVRAKPWTYTFLPRKVLIMRFQALGDTVITLPYLQGIRDQYPEIELHFLTRKEVSDIPSSLNLFDQVTTIGGGRNTNAQFIELLFKLPQLLMQRYDAVIDLQNHRLSSFVRKILQPKAWVEFDKYSPLSAGERTRQTLEALWNWKIPLSTNLRLKISCDHLSLLKANGYKSEYKLVVLNPAGFCSSRNWPIEYYAEFALLWLSRNPMTQFALLLLPAHKDKAAYLKEKLGERCIDLTGLANQVDAFSIIKMAQLVLSEDSGLMHMSWVQGVPTLALFSSSRKDWSSPLGSWSYCLDSSDLQCGPCGLEVCQYGDNRCLTRYTPKIVLNRAMGLLSSLP
jgi:ADP-heptose:LPS heptosyltransferase